MAKTQNSGSEQKLWRGQTSRAALLSLGGIILFSNIGQNLGKDIWQAALIGAVLGGAYLLLWKFCQTKAGDLELGALNRQAFGEKWGLIVNFFYWAVFVIMGGYLLYSIVEFWNYMGARSVNVLLFGALILLVAAVGANFGVRAVQRLGWLLLALLALTFVVDMLFVFTQLSFERFLPFTGVDLSSSLPQGAKLGLFLVFFLPLFWQGGGAKGLSAKGAWAGYGIAAAYLILSTFRNVAMLGDSVSLQAYSTLQSLKMAQWSSAAMRLELIGVMVMIAVAVGFIILLFAGLENFAANLWGKVVRKKLSLWISALGIFFSLAAWDFFFAQELLEGPWNILPWLLLAQLILGIGACVKVWLKSRKKAA